MNAFFDESGKFKDHKVVSFCGVVSAPAQFQSFTVDWGRHLHENGLQMLTAKDALNARIRLSEKNPALGIDNRIAALLPFIASVRKHLEAVTGVAIDVAAFKALPSHYFQVLGDNPFFTGFLRAILELLRLVGEQDRITLICDDEEQMALPMYKLYRRVKLIDHQAREKLAAISFADTDFYLDCRQPTCLLHYSDANQERDSTKPTMSIGRYLMRSPHRGRKGKTYGAWDSRSVTKRN